MMTKERTGWIGEWEVVVCDLNGNVIERTEIKPNLIMDVGLNMLRDILSGAKTDGEIKYVALGSGTTATAANQTQLSSEKFRKLTTAQTNDVVPGRLITELFISDTEANSFKCEEIGWFAGTGATGSANTGIMVARVLYSRQKTNLESWTIRRTDTIARG